VLRVEWSCVMWECRIQVRIVVSRSHFLIDVLKVYVICYHAKHSFTSPRALMSYNCVISYADAGFGLLVSQGAHVSD
jgi:hypothetical protein